MHAWLHACMLACLRACVRACVCVCTRVHMHACVCTCARVRVRAYARSCVCTRACMHVRPYARLCVCVCVHVRARACTCFTCTFATQPPHFASTVFPRVCALAEHTPHARTSHMMELFRRSYLSEAICQNLRDLLPWSACAGLLLLLRPLASSIASLRVGSTRVTDRGLAVVAELEALGSLTLQVGRAAPQL